MYVRPERHKFYKTKLWKKTREAYFNHIGGLCERCKAAAEAEGRLSDVKADIIHHKKELNDLNINDPKYTIDFENLEGLCHSCHNQDHKKGGEATRDNSHFTAAGEFIIKED